MSFIIRKLCHTVQTNSFIKFVLFMTFTMLYIYFSYKSLPPRRILRPTSGKNSTITWRIIRKFKQSNVDLYALEEEMAERRNTLYQACQDYPEANLSPNAWEFVIDAHHSLVWCNVFKAASSAWIHNFNLLGGYDETYLMKSKQNPITLLRAKFPRPTNTQLKVALESSMSFLIVRDPLERLLSAYRNKIESMHGNYYSKMAKTIISKYRAAEKKRVGIRPTFKEFTQYVINSKPDEHWAPIYKFCTPCSVNFTVIAKLDTLNQDQEYIIKKAGIEDILRPERTIKHHAIQGLSRTKSLLRRYYSQLDLITLHKLIEFYRIDYEMFGYNVTKYYEYIRKP